MMQSSMAQFAKPAHKEASRHLGYALTLGDFDAWHRAAIIFARALTPEERSGAAWAFLATLDHRQREDVASTLMTGSDAPLPTFMAPLQDARFWAGMANRSELKAYALAAFETMRPRDQVAFLSHVQGRSAT